LYYSEVNTFCISEHLEAKTFDELGSSLFKFGLNFES
jgi:hypothetical protein